VEEKVARADGGTSVIEAHKGDSSVKGMPKVNGNGRHQVVDTDWERRKMGDGGGGLLEDLGKDCEEADFLVLPASGGIDPLLQVIHAGRTAPAPWPMLPEGAGLRSILGPATGVAGGTDAVTRAVTSLGQGGYLRFSG
jgi:hypothetical protein